jgi:D-psicose/D-tagatose/L-ribulose 3-epimerase
MKHGIYYAYWEQEWKADYRPYIEKAARLGFDVLEIAATPLPSMEISELRELKELAKTHGIALTCGHGPSAGQNLGSADPSVRAEAKRFYADLLQRLEILDIHVLGGGIYSYWPVDYSRPVDKPGDRARSIAGVREMAHLAGECGVDYCLEALNRFEGYLLNTAAEAVAFVREVDHPAARVMLDTFHMNIEEDGMGEAIRTAGPLLGHFHTGECNRRVPGKGRMPWREIGEALRGIGYDGCIVMEPFVRMGGTVGSDIKVWRDLSQGADEAGMDEEARLALEFSRTMLG